MPALYVYRATQGRTFTLPILREDSNGDPINLTGYTAKFQVRPSPESNTVLVSLTEADGITVGGTDGMVTITIAAAVMATLAAGSYWAELELLAPSDQEPAISVMPGPFLVSPSTVR